MSPWNKLKNNKWARRTAFYIGVSSALYLYSSYNSPRNKDKRLLESHGAIVEFDFRGRLTESPRPLSSFLSWLSSLGGPPPTPFLEIIQAIQRAENDPHVKGIIANVGRVGNEAQVEELSQLIRSFNQTGKVSIAYCESPDQPGYSLASAFRECFLHPASLIPLTGYYVPQFFFKGTLDTLGVTPQMIQSSPSKTFSNQFTEEQFTPEHKKQIKKIVNTKFNLLAKNIADNRDISIYNMEDIINQGPFVPKKALNTNLIDGIYYRDEIIDVFEKEFPNVPILPSHRYINATQPLIPPKLNRIGVIYLNGSLLSSSPALSNALTEAQRNPFIKSVIIRVNCPGGDAALADSIWRDVHNLTRVKPVVVSVGATCASGGYYAVLPASHIFALENSLVGSIGVVGGSFGFAGLMEKLGVNFEEVKRGEFSKLNFPLTNLNEQEMEKTKEILEAVEENFIHKVKESRQFSFPQTEALSTGEIWMGREAKRLGLIDEVGGLSAAIQKARELCGTADLPIQELPSPQMGMYFTSTEYPFAKEENSRKVQRFPKQQEFSRV